MIHDDRQTLTDSDLWTFMEAGCNSEEVAAFAGVSRMTAVAMMDAARHSHVRSAQETAFTGKTNQGSLT